MATKARVLEMMREGIDLEERSVMAELDESLGLIDGLDLPQTKKKLIAERLELLRRETIQHIELFKAANAEVQHGKGEY